MAATSLFTIGLDNPVHNKADKADKVDIQNSASGVSTLLNPSQPVQLAQLDPSAQSAQLPPSQPAQLNPSQPVQLAQSAQLPQSQPAQLVPSQPAQLSPSQPAQLVPSQSAPVQPDQVDQPQSILEEVRGLTKRSGEKKDVKKVFDYGVEEEGYDPEVLKKIFLMAYEERGWDTKPVEDIKFYKTLAEEEEELNKLPVTVQDTPYIKTDLPIDEQVAALRDMRTGAYDPINFALGFMSDEQAAVNNKKLADTNQYIIDELGNRGTLAKIAKGGEKLGSDDYADVEYADAGEILYLGPNKNWYRAEEGFFDTLGDALLEQKHKIINSVGGAIIGAKVGAGFGPYGAGAGALLGASAGVFGGHFIDRLVQAQNLKLNLDLLQLLKEASEYGIGEIAYNIIGIAGTKITYETIKQLKAFNTYAKSMYQKSPTKELIKEPTSKTIVSGIKDRINKFYINEKGALDALIKHSGKTKEQLTDLVSKLEKFTGVIQEGSPVTQMVRAYLFLSETNNGSINLLSKGKQISKTEGKHALDMIKTQTEQVYSLINSLTDDNLDVQLPAALKSYEGVVADSYENIKALGHELVQNNVNNLPKYKFKFDELVNKELIKFIDTKIKGTNIEKNFIVLINTIQNIGKTNNSRKIINDELLPFQSAIDNAKKAEAQEKISIALSKGGNAAELEKKLQSLTSEKEILESKLFNVEKSLTSSKKAADTNNTNLGKRKAYERFEKHNITANDYKLQIKKINDKIKKINDLAKPNSNRILKSTENLNQAKKNFNQAKDALSKKFPQLTEISNPPRDFDDLLDLRNTINKFANALPKNLVNKNDVEMINGIKKAIDKEIEYVKKTYMGKEGSKWHEEWLAQNIEYSKMKNLQEFSFYKALTNESLDKEKVVKIIINYATTRDGTFEKILEVLPNRQYKGKGQEIIPDSITQKGIPNVRIRNTVEGAAIKYFIKDATTKDGLAIDFVKVANNLQSIPMKNSTNRKAQRIIKNLSIIYKTNPEIARALHSSTISSETGNTLATSIIGKVQMVFMSKFFNNIMRMSPLDKGKELALIKQAAIVLDNPIHQKSVTKLMDELPKDPHLNSALAQLQQNFAKYGTESNYDGIQLFTITDNDNTPKIFSEPIKLKGGEIANLPNSAKFYIDENVAITKRNTSTSTSKLVTEKYSPHLIATPEIINEILGKEVNPKNYNTPEVLEILQDYNGINIEDYVYIFESNIIK